MARADHCGKLLFAPLVRFLDRFVFQGRRAGRFVDVGASDGVTDSITAYFERRGWDGVLVEPVGALADASWRLWLARG